MTRQNKMNIMRLKRAKLRSGKVFKDPPTKTVLELSIKKEQAIIDIVKYSLLTKQLTKCLGPVGTLLNRKQTFLLLLV